MDIEKSEFLTTNAASLTEPNIQQTNSLALEIHPDFKTNGDTDNNNSNSEKNLPGYCRRTQSAKARSRQVIDNSKKLHTRPQSAGTLTRGSASSQDKTVPVVNLAQRVVPELFEIEKERLLALPDPRNYSQNACQDFPPMHFSKPSLRNLQSEVNENCCYKKDKPDKNGLKPSIYGLQRQRQFYGSAPDLTSADGFSKFPYKLSDDVDTDIKRIEYKKIR